MEAVKTEKDGELLCIIYKNVTMGSESIINLMPKVNNEKLKADMTDQLNKYDEYAKKVREALSTRGVEPKEENIMTKMSARMGMAMNTIMDQSTSHLAGMMIQGSTMDVVDLIKNIREFDEEGAGDEVLSLAREIVKFEENNIEKMKQYL